MTTTPITTTTTTLPQRGKYATAPEEWEAQRDTIIHLYIGKQKTLRQLIPYMRDEHQFLATARQYKFHLAKWGVRKYSRRAERESLREDKATTDKPRTKTEATDSPHTVIKRLPPQAHGLKVSTSYIFSPTDPERVRVPDLCLRLYQQYVMGAFATGLWKTLPDTEESMAEDVKLMAWYNHFPNGLEYFKRGQTKKAFKLFHDAFGLYAERLKVQDPRLFVYMHLLAVYCSDLAPELTRMIYKFAADLTRIMYGSSRHPLYLYLLYIARMHVQDLRRSGRAIGDCLINLVQDRLDARAESRAKLSPLAVQINNFLSIKHLLDVDLAVQAAEDAVARLQMLPQDTADRQIRIKLFLVNMFEELNLLDRAHKLIAELLASDAIKEDVRSLVYIYHAMVLIARKDGNFEPVLQISEKFTETAINFLHQSTYHRGITSPLLAELAVLLREFGRVEEADKIHKVLEEAEGSADNVEEGFDHVADVGKNDEELED